MSIVNKNKSGIKSQKPAPRRRRRQPDAVRTAALESARKLLLVEGPDAITLKAVARDLGMTHTNLIHHFGSAGELQSALMRDMVRHLTDTLEAAVARFRAGAGDVREFIDIVFDAFDKGGAGQLAAWLMVSGNAKLFAPVGQVVRDYIAHVEQGAHIDPSETAEMHRRFTSTTLFVVTSAFGDAIIGDELRKMVHRERETVRNVVGELLPQFSALAREKLSQTQK
jgi:AcrR family transcriptional regulator